MSLYSSVLPYSRFSKMWCVKQSPLQNLIIHCKQNPPNHTHWIFMSHHSQSETSGVPEARTPQTETSQTLGCALTSTIFQSSMSSRLHLRQILGSLLVNLYHRITPPPTPTHLHRTTPLDIPTVLKIHIYSTDSHLAPNPFIATCIVIFIIFYNIKRQLPHLPIKFQGLEKRNFQASTFSSHYFSLLV